MKIFSGSSNKPLAEKIAQHLGMSLSPLEIFVFPDGERRIWIEETVVDQDAVIVQSTSTPVDAQYMELFFIVDALKRSGARSVTVVMPYIGYQRQDHVFRSGEAVSLDVVMKMMHAVGIEEVIAFDAHTIKIPELFTMHHLPMKHLTALELFSKTIRDSYGLDDAVLVTPDMGGIRRIKIISEMLGNIPYTTVVKNRDLATGTLDVSQFEGEVKKKVFIVDDMASSGKTLVEAARLMQEHGAEDVYAFVTHAIFSKEAPELLEHSLIKKIFVTDTVLVPEEKKFAKLEIISVAEMVANSLKN